MTKKRGRQLPRGIARQTRIIGQRKKTDPKTNLCSSDMSSILLKEGGVCTKTMQGANYSAAKDERIMQDVEECAYGMVQRFFSMHQRGMQK